MSASAAAERHRRRLAYRAAVDALHTANRAAIDALRERQTARQTVRRLAREL